MIPISYYGRGSGLAHAVEALQDRPGLHMGAVGLGAGTMAAYGRAGDRVRFYDINPQMIDIAHKYFAFLAGSQAAITIVEGDARLSLNQELAQHFDLLVLDAFSGDAVPPHLLTREAFAIYLRHLAPHGIVAVHISSDYFDLTPVLRGIAQVSGLHGVRVVSEENEALGLSSAAWVLLSRRTESLQHGELPSAGQPLQTSDRIEYWSDDYTNMFRLIGTPER
jgi:spermidine synthase